MTDTPPGMASSWVDLSREISAAGYVSPISSAAGYVSPISPRRLTHGAIPFGSDNDYMRMLRHGGERILLADGFLIWICTGTVPRYIGRYLVGRYLSTVPT